METMCGVLKHISISPKLTLKIPNYSWNELVLSFDEIKIS